MENQQLNLLDRVYTVLRKRGEETEWITSADNHEIRTGIAFVPCDTFTPVSLLYTMIEHPETLVIDVLFAAKVPESRRDGEQGSAVSIIQSRSTALAAGLSRNSAIRLPSSPVESASPQMQASTSFSTESATR